jgi:hypothetical protein
MEIAGPAGILILREPDLWGDSQHDYPHLLLLPKFPPPPGSLLNFYLSGFPDFRAQFEQRLSQFQDWREPLRNPTN